MSEVRLVAIDLDGTLLRSDRTISPRSRAAINAARAAGIDVVIATARSPRSTREIAAEAGVGGLAICANGAIVFDLDADRIVTHRPLAAATAHRLVTGLRDACPGVVFGWEYELRFGSEPAYEAQRNADWWPRPEDSFPACDPLEWAQPMTKLLARPAPNDLDHVHVIAAALAGTDATTTLAGTAFVEMAAPGVGKESALAELAADRDLVSDNVIALGDHLTDLEMIRWAGLGIAVANAHPSVIAAADEVTQSNDDDGVAIVLERLVAA